MYCLNFDSSSYSSLRVSVQVPIFQTEIYDSVKIIRSEVSLLAHTKRKIVASSVSITFFEVPLLYTDSYCPQLNGSTYVFLNFTLV